MSDDFKKILKKLHNDPVLFVRTVLKAEPQKWQIEALTAVVKSNKVAIKSGHGVGKSTYLSWLCLWFLLTRIPAKIVATANTASQLQDVLANDVQKWSKELPKGFLDQLEFKQDRVALKGSPDSFLSYRVSRRENPEALAGFHSQNMLAVVDEASGIPESIFETSQGTLSTPNAKIVLAGNPTRSSGFFYECFHTMRDSWHCMTVSSKDGEYVSDEFIQDMAKKYGEESNVFRIRVLGEFSTSDDDTLIGLDLVESAVKREVERDEYAPVVWGVDPARYGDDRTALAKRQGGYLLEKVKTWQGKDLMSTAGIVLSEYEATPYPEKPSQIFIDSIGLGAGLVDRLIELDLPAVGINVAESPALGQKFSRLRDELWWKAREFFEAKDCKMPDDATLIKELTAVKYQYLSSGKLKVEGKDQLKKRGLRSPDCADAFLLTFAMHGAFGSGKLGSWNRRNSIRPDLNWVV